MYLSVGTTLQSGKYRLEKCLGQGGFGITYLATQVGLNRKVAIKEFFMADYCEREESTLRMTVPTKSNRDFVSRFLVKFIKEAQNIAALNHPNIIRIYDIFEENETAYYVMEYHPDGSLWHRVVQQRHLNEETALCYIRQMADALDYIHRQQICHLDVKPENVLLDIRNNAVLIDFGLSKHYDKEGQQTSSTPVGISDGYAPLEQYQRGGVATFSPTTDIYSLGATLYALLTGKIPPTAAEVNEEGLPALPDYISKTTVQTIEKAMLTRRKERPQTIAEFLEFLNKGVVEEPLAGKTIVKPNLIKKEHLTDAINGHECVDLGLSVKWATCNVGASLPSEYGSYFAWGEIKPKLEYSEENRAMDRPEMREIAGNRAYDVARASWGEGWRLPTMKEFMELIDRCQWKWTTLDEREGYEITGPNGHFIFLPATGSYYGTSLFGVGENGYYWSATTDGRNTQSACCLYFNKNHYIRHWYHRFCGRSVRPVVE